MTTKDAIQALGDYVLQKQNPNRWNGCALAGTKDIKSISENGEVVTQDKIFWIKSLKPEYALDATYRRKIY